MITTKTAKRKRLEKAGWRAGSAQEFLGLKPEEAAIVNMRLSLAGVLRMRRTRLGLSQSDLAPVRAILATGGKPADVGHAIAAA